MLIVVLGVQAQPAHGALAVLLGERLGVGIVGADHGRPLAGCTLDGIVGRRHGNRQRIGGAALPAPMAERMQLGRYVLGNEVLQADAMGLAPVHPVIGMVELDTNIAHQPAPRHVLARMPGEAGLGQVLRHVQRELLHHRPPADQVVAHGARAQLVVAHSCIELMLDDPTLVRRTVFDQFLRPLGITLCVHQRTQSNKRIVHWQTSI